MANDMQPKGKNKALTVIIIAIIAILIIILAVLALTQKEDTNTPDSEKNAPANETGDIDEPILDEEATEQEIADREEIAEEIENARPQVEGGNLVTEDNRVITPEGEDARNDVEPGSPDAPQQTAPVEEESLPEETVKLGISAAGFSPAEVRMPANSAVTMSVTSTDDNTHIFKFKDDALSSVAVGIAPMETRAITFQTPGPGEYEFYCDVPGHEGRGEVGTMIVE
ncbi:MAG TPA: cupredoxin domain-containing protein [Patescibacteria group bacterium]|nr:cupredoxin domain-containing protein [Patescibacteria group bacterium]